MEFEEFLSSEEAKIDGEQSIRDAMKQFNATETDESEAPEPPAEPPVVEEPPTNESPKAEPPVPQQQEQSKEERARNAERRRQHEASIAQKALENSTEYRAMQALARLSGKSPEQLWQDIYEAQIAQEMQQQYGQELPPETVRQVAYERQLSYQAQQQQEQVQEQLTQVQFEQWQGRMANEKQAILTAHPYLNDADVDAARDYMLQVIQNPNVPLEQAVYALHGTKILTGQQEKLRTELLAEMSGRKNTPLPRQGGATPPAEVLSADERFVAKMLGISEEDYLKHK